MRGHAVAGLALLIVLASVMPTIADGPGVASQGGSNRGILLSASDPSLNWPGGLLLNGTVATIVVEDISGLLSSVKLVRPAGDVVLTASVAGGRAVFIGADVGEAGRWKVTDPTLLVTLTTFDVDLFDGSISNQNNVVNVFEDPVTFVSDLLGLPQVDAGIQGRHTHYTQYPGQCSGYSPKTFTHYYDGDIGVFHAIVDSGVDDLEPGGGLNYKVMEVTWQPQDGIVTNYPTGIDVAPFTQDSTNPMEVYFIAQTDAYSPYTDYYNVHVTVGNNCADDVTLYMRQS